MKPFHSLVLVLTLLMAGPVKADDGSDIRVVIGDQIAAFAAEDLSSAFNLASPMIKGMFGSPENFGRMVRDGYPMIWRPDAYEFGGLRQEQGRLLQRLAVRDASGQAYLFDFDMIAGPEGWQVNGVYPVPQPDVGV